MVHLLSCAPALGYRPRGAASKALLAACKTLAAAFVKAWPLRRRRTTTREVRPLAE